MSQPFTDTDQSFAQAVSTGELEAGELEFNLLFLKQAARYRAADGSYRFRAPDGSTFVAHLSTATPPRVRSETLRQSFASVGVQAGQLAHISFANPQDITISIAPPGALPLKRAPVPMKTTTTGAGFPLNTILYGPPGTGKTFKTAELAVRICDGAVPATRELLMARYEVLRKEGRVSFVTFHQSYGYEDFVEGLRPELNDGVISYAVRPGILRDACDAAKRSTLAVPGLAGKPLKDRTIYKMSLGRAGTTEGKLVFQECMEGKYVLLGWGDDVDFSECKSLEAIATRVKEADKPLGKPESVARYVNVFKNELQVGDIIIASQGNSAFRAIGEVTGEYEFLEAPAAGRFHQMRRIRWLAVFEGNHAVAEIYDRTFVQSTLYKLVPSGLDFAILESLVQGDTGAANHAFVLIIDEINRANISKVFGELITLIEPDKRSGELNALTVRLPYSGSDFSVPSNLSVVGTMNTADRSIALLDTALRRRFEFEELEPDYLALPEAPIGGVDLRLMLRALNERIEYLYDRDHAIGHAYFIHVENLTDLDRVFRRKVLPLLQEYFYEDWSKVRSVLSDAVGGFIESDSQIPHGLGAAAETYDAKPRYSVRKDAFPLSAYLKIYE